jgi:hypothetical protein
MKFTTYVCDNCKAKADRDETFIERFAVYNQAGQLVELELCKNCVRGIIRRVMLTKPFQIRAWCTTCNKTGAVVTGELSDNAGYDKCKVCKLE